MARLKTAGTRRTAAVSTEAPAALADVFISYARTDKDVAKNVAETLRAEGFDVWFDQSIYAGARWEELLMSTLASAKSVLVLWSKRSVTRRWVRKEARIAFATNRLVPVKIDNCRPPKGFDSHQIAMMPGWNGTGHHPELERLFAGLARLAPPSRIDNVRPGFDTNFLGVPIDLPAIKGVGQEFRYLHFSVVMNPTRRLAWYTAYNTKPYVPVKRGDRWMSDPMLPATFQPSDAIFLRSGYERGHIARARAVSWGTEREAQIANRQAFFWTNTVPQTHNMNCGWWLQIEQWEEQLVSKRGRAIGFAGPILSDSDPVIGDVEQVLGRLKIRQRFHLPLRFWKVVAVAGARRRLEVAAFLVDQHALRKQEDPATFRTTVEKVEARTGLDFGETIRKAKSIVA